MKHERLLPLIVATALFIENMDSTAIATSLPAIAADFGVEPVALKLALTTYMLALAVFIPISGWVADRFGARPTFMTAIGVFLLGSIGCAMSDSLGALIAARFLQGMGGAMMTPVARLVLVRVTPRNQLVDAMAWLSIPGLVGPILGPPIGGFITTFASWHWIFLINVPIGLIGVLMVNKYLPDWQRNEPRKLDFTGFLLAGVCFAGFVFGISVLTLPALPAAFGYGSMLLGVIAGAVYWLHFRRTEHPILDLRLFAQPLFRLTMIGGTVFRLGTGAMPFLFPLMLQLAFGLSPFESGMVTFASAVGAFAMKFVAERIIARIGFRSALITACTITAAGVLAMGLYSPGTPTPIMMGFLVITGFFQSLFWTTTNAFIFADIEDKDAGQANVMSQVSVQLSLAFGVALGGGALEGFRLIHGGEPLLQDFHWAFWLMAVITLVSALIFIRVPKTTTMASHHTASEPAE